MFDSDSVSRISRMAKNVRARAPLVHNVTNLVVQNETAQAIAAIGGTQVTLHHPEEAAQAASACDALAVNLGTPNDELLLTAHKAVEAVKALARPWVLDPVAAGFTPYRTEAAMELLALGPTLVKANASEVLALSGARARGRAADSVHAVAEAEDAARELSETYGCVVAITGSEDLVTDGERTAVVCNGHPLMGRMIGSGCMLTAVAGCFLAVEQDPFYAALGAMGCFAVAGEYAALNAAGPATMGISLIDALDALEPKEIGRRLRLRSS